MDLPQLSGTSGGTDGARHLIRPCTPEDLAWMIDLAVARYPGGFDHAQAKAWIPTRMAQDNMFFVRGERGCGVANLIRRFNAPDRLQCYMLFIAAHPCTGANLMEPFHLMDAMRDWGKDRGATAFWFSDITGYDFAAYAKRRGGRLAGHTYVIDLDGKGTPYG